MLSCPASSARYPEPTMSVIPDEVAQQRLVGVKPRCGFEEEEAINTMDTPRTSMDRGMVWSADGRSVFFVSGAAVKPFFDVVDVRQYCRDSAARDLASTVPGENGTSLSWCEKSLGALLFQHCVLAIPNLANQLTVAT